MIVPNHEANMPHMVRPIHPTIIALFMLMQYLPLRLPETGTIQAVWCQRREMPNAEVTMPIECTSVFSDVTSSEMSVAQLPNRIGIEYCTLPDT